MKKIKSRNIIIFCILIIVLYMLDGTEFRYSTFQYKYNIVQESREETIECSFQLYKRIDISELNIVTSRVSLIYEANGEKKETNLFRQGRSEKSIPLLDTFKENKNDFRGLLFDDVDLIGYVDISYDYKKIHASFVETQNNFNGTLIGY